MIGDRIERLLQRDPLTDTLNRRAFSALSHAWNFELAISDTGPTLWAVPPVSCDFSRMATQSSGMNWVLRNRIGASRSMAIVPSRHSFVRTTVPLKVDCWQSVPEKSASIRVDCAVPVLTNVPVHPRGEVN